MKYNKTHPYTIWKYLYKFAFLFIIPLFQQILFHPKNLIDIINAAGINSIFTIFIILWAIFEYRKVGYHASTKEFNIAKGILIKHSYSIPYERIYSVTTKEQLLPASFGAISFEIDTPAGNKKSADISIMLSRKRLIKTMDLIFPNSNEKIVYKASAFKILLMTISWSNSATGLLLAAPFINKLGDILGEKISEKLYSTVNLSLKLAAIGIPPTAAAIAYILTAGWIIAFLTQLFRYANFLVKQDNENILIRRGLIGKTNQIIIKNKISAISIRQTILMKMFNLYSAQIHIIGSGKDKKDKSLLIASASYKDLQSSLEKLSPFRVQLDLTYKPEKGSLKSFIMIPFTILLSTLSLLIILSLNLPYNTVLIFLILFLVPFVLWWTILRVLAYENSGISVYKDTLVISGYKNLSLISGCVPYNKIQFIKLTQNPFQKRLNRCNIKVYIFSEKNESFSINHISKPLAKDILNTISLNSFNKLAN